MAWLDSRTITISLFLFFLPVLLLCIILSLPILVFLICASQPVPFLSLLVPSTTPAKLLLLLLLPPGTLYVTAWLIYLFTAQTDHSFNLPYNPVRILKVNYAAANLIWGAFQSIPLAASVLYWRYVVVGGRAAVGELRFEEFAR
ncbi:LOW QUALITY PROTEIN: hypothetical protein BC936DRAFT_138661 [Jimgerdemannia flammicorona]|uniref:Uncharacterized protein n=1 Tax=Jimgerdemannia flammicorona TaxID=994334 RepID=A0A433BVI8_9FUNG|nr:LOW QUALITY PROTEIN: hypothetical protein BC936DRAFT_138661 [Jimgerdemannia flammicorona]